MSIFHNHPARPLLIQRSTPPAERIENDRDARRLNRCIVAVIILAVLWVGGQVVRAWLQGRI